ncbi:putative membrane protein [Homoserinimonas aerilata]|uniref:Putative membrane protein n=1 Tax=Homoserinimonas aerilata TaxID=1162970 RepID=A0A542YF84_9MICO|nr:hypothetical protein [Homoserinimonas aerilata]TQL46753.1 putative membrane protein [Homoserinimonas aerilata]
MLTTFTTTLGQVAADHGPVMAHWAGGGFPWFVVFVPLFWIAVFVGLFVFAGRRRREHFAHREWNATAGARDAEKTLAERFAQGDIDETEYRARLEVLRANRPEPRAP